MITKELPTKPGRYLWREIPGTASDRWRFVEVTIEDGRLVADSEEHFGPLEQWQDEGYGIGEWYRIPDPDSNDELR